MAKELNGNRMKILIDIAIIVFVAGMAWMAVTERLKTVEKNDGKQDKYIEDLREDFFDESRKVGESLVKIETRQTALIDRIDRHYTGPNHP